MDQVPYCKLSMAALLDRSISSTIFILAPLALRSKIKESSRIRDSRKFPKESIRKQTISVNILQIFLFALSTQKQAFLTHVTRSIQI